ncbi:type III secretion system effector protein [Xanthomonas translucens pv. hordei]|nr:type III secretion system effector protein [Xanthomonas translucens]UKE58266.1 type III secretion system effector protein [Xanthomonas translucens pv. hordei]WIH01275.1 type III secretion system effector protein [Xanthomonas translucens pv. hordei]
MPHAASPAHADRPDRHMFSIVRHLSFLSTDRDAGRVPAAAAMSGNGVVFSRSKKVLGGSDVGMIGMIDGQEHLVKTGISRSLLGQAVTFCVDGQVDEANKRLGYIVGGAARLLKTDPKQGNQKQVLIQAFHAFLQTDKGKQLADKAKTDTLDIADVGDIHASLVDADPQLRNTLGVPILFDVINVAAGQQLVNALQGTYLPKKHMPDSSLLAVQNNALIASRLIPEAKPLDTFLTEAFLPRGVSLKDAKRAAALVKAPPATSSANSDELTQAQALMAQINNPDHLRAGKQALKETLDDKGLDGLFVSLLARFTLGEDSDLGPDNMLVVPGDDGRNKTVSIDVTGFRYEWENDTPAGPRNPPRHGWGKVIDNPALALDVLLDGSVMKSRYARGLESVHAAVVDCLRDALHQNATPEAQAVKRWYAALDVHASTASLLALHQGLGDIAKAPWMPDASLVDQVLERNAGFINDIVHRART